MNPQEFYKRTARLLNPERLASKRVLVVGVGSGGSRVAAELGRLGLQLTLVDRPGECLEEHNIVRHLLGYRSLGKAKLPELRRAIRNVNPSARIKCVELDVAENAELLEALLIRWRPDLIAVCTDNEQSKHAINHQSVRLGIPQVGAGVYDGGIGGEVYRARPGEACYGCIARQLQLERYTPPSALSRDYSRPENPDDLSSCALNLDIEQIACLQTRMILDELLGPGSQFVGLDPAINLWVFGNRVVPATFARPFHAEFFNIEKCSGCLECGSVDLDLEAHSARILAGLDLKAGRPAQMEESPHLSKTAT